MRMRARHFGSFELRLRYRDLVPRSTTTLAGRRPDHGNLAEPARPVATYARTGRDSWPPLQHLTSHTSQDRIGRPDRR